MRAAGVALVLVAALAAPAVAEPPALAPPGAAEIVEPPPAATPRPGPGRSRWSISLAPELRLTGADWRAGGFRRGLVQDGWIPTHEALPGLRAEALFCEAPIADLGVVVAFAGGDIAKATDATDAPAIHLRTTQLGGVMRIHWGRPDAIVAAWPRLEGGFLAERVSLGGQDLDRTLTYARAGLDLRAGGRHVGAVLAGGFTVATTRDDGWLAPPVGGVDLSLGMDARW
jgi:hypothetical protein